MPNWNKVVVSGSNASLNSLTVSNGITGSLLGTASYATQALSASYAATASYVTGSIFTNSNSAASASFAQTASYATYAVNGGVTQLLAGPNISLSPTNGLGQVTVSSTPGGGGFNTATGSYGSFYSTQTQTNVASTARSMSLNTTDITNGVSISGSTNPYNTYIKTENAGVYDIQFSAQVDKTDSGTDEIWIWIRKNGTDLSDTATSVQLVGNGAHYVAAWNFFVNAAAGDYYQLMWYSPDANVRLHAEPAFGIVPGIPSLIVTANRVDQFLSNTGSFSGSFTGTLTGTASYATQALSASYAPSAGGAAFPFTGSAQITGSLGVTGSLIVKQNATTGSLDTSNRTLQDDRNKTSIDWNNRLLYDTQTPPTQSVEWTNRTLHSSTGADSVRWDYRILTDPTNIDSANWEYRTLNDDHGTAALSWDVYDKGFTIASNYYYRSEISLNDQGQFVDTPEATTSEPNYAGEVITGYIDDTVTGYDLIYLNTNGVWYPVTQATDQCTKLLGICLVKPTLIGQNPGPILLEGTITVLSTGATYADSPIINGLDHGLPIYIETSYGNLMTTTAPTNSGAYVRVLGHAYQQSSTYSDYWIMKFRPSNDWITI